MPTAIMAGVSYDEFFRMTLKEIRAVVEGYTEYIKNSEKARAIDAACTAYYGALFVRTRDFPRSIKDAFPGLFGRTAEGGIDVQKDWKESKRVLMEIARQHNANIKAGEDYDDR